MSCPNLQSLTGLVCAGVKDHNKGVQPDTHRAQHDAEGGLHDIDILAMPAEAVHSPVCFLCSLCGFTVEGLPLHLRAHQHILHAIECSRSKVLESVGSVCCDQCDMVYRSRRTTETFWVPMASRPQWPQQPHHRDEWSALKADLAYALGLTLKRGRTAEAQSAHQTRLVCCASTR
jgi:hypothetical protein